MSAADLAQLLWLELEAQALELSETGYAYQMSFGTLLCRDTQQKLPLALIACLQVFVL